MVSGFDIILVTALVAFTVNGFAKGLISKVLSLAALLGGVIIAAKYGMDLSQFLSRLVGIGDILSGVICISLIFIVLFVAAGMLARAFKKISIIQIWDKTGGAVFGLVEGALILSLLLLLLAVFDIPAPGPSLDRSFSYKPLKSFAPTLYRSFLSRSSVEYLDRFFFSGQSENK
ncbi:MAG TPA: CvpA family protein [Candidatus Kryptonia bacterium]